MLDCGVVEEHGRERVVSHVSSDLISYCCAVADDRYLQTGRMPLRVLCRICRKHILLFEASSAFDFKIARYAEEELQLHNPRLMPQVLSFQVQRHCQSPSAPSTASTPNVKHHEICIVGTLQSELPEPKQRKENRIPSCFYPVSLSAPVSFLVAPSSETIRFWVWHPIRCVAKLPQPTVLEFVLTDPTS